MVTREVQLSGLIKRDEAARALGLSRGGIRKLEGVHLTPVTVDRAVYYDRDQLDQLMLVRSGEASKLAFALFEEGAGPAAVVAAHGIPPATAERLWESWRGLKQREGRTLVIELPHNVRSAPWLTVHRFDPEEGVPPAFALQAIQLVAKDPSLRERVYRAAGLRKCAADEEDDGDQEEPAA